jgi:hypothetical protein
MGTNADPSRTNPFIGTLAVTLILDNKEHVLIDAAHIVDCYFIEDIFTHVILGKLRFYDLYNLQEKGPLTGTEYISIIYGGHINRILKFKLYDIKYIQTADANPVAGSLIEASFVDTSYETMLESVYSRSFATGMPYTTIVKELLKNIVGWTDENIHMEDCSNENPTGFAIPYWSIARACRFLLRRAVGKKSKTSGYLIYNSTENSISANVKTLNFLFSKENNYDPIHYHFEAPDTGDTKKPEYKTNKILEWKIEGRSRSGTNAIFGGRWRGVNTSKGKLDVISYDFAKGIKESMLLGKKSLFPDESDTGRLVRNTAERNELELKAVLYDEWCKTYSPQNQVSVLMQGNEKRYCGHLINIEWPSYDDKYEIYHKQMQGLWLVRAITHMFKPDGPYPYTQKLILIKNAYTYSKSTQLIEATKVNVTGGVRAQFLATD